MSPSASAVPAHHTDSAEEILYLVAGEAEAEVGDEHGRLTAGDLAVIPAMVPHGLLNVGDETVKVVGFFSESEIISRPSRSRCSRSARQSSTRAAPPPRPPEPPRAQTLTEPDGSRPVRLVQRRSGPPASPATSPSPPNGPEHRFASHLLV